jgi:hypothetical protein
MGFFESFEGSARTARHTRRVSLRHQADLFYEALSGEAPRPAPPAPPIPPWMPPAEARAPLPVEWDDVDTYVETVPTFPVGVPETVSPPTGFEEMPVHVEAWVPNAAGRGLVIADFVCRTQAELDATLPFVPVATPRPLWQTNAAGRLEALLEALVFHPATAAGGSVLPAGRHPLAIICHGNHNVVRADGTEILSHQGYSGPPAVGPGPYLQEALAERGIISASVNMNPANLLQTLIETRALLTIAALRLMQRLDRTAASRYYRKIDFQRVAFIGHSRGGDGVARAMRLLSSNTRVRALVQLAPTDSTGILQGTAPPVIRLPLPAGAPAPPPNALLIPAGAPAPRFVTRPGTIPESGSPRQLIIWGSRDGDVSGQQDVRTDVSVNPFRHYDRSAVERAFQFWHGATHNRFNRLWTDAEEDRNCGTSCITTDPNAAATLLSRPNQEARTIEMVRGWLLFALYDETTEAARFDGRTPTAVDAARPIAGMWKFGQRLVTIDQFDDVQPARNTLGGANVTPPTGVFDEITVANENGAGAGLTAYQFPHIDRALRYSPAPLPTSGVRVSGVPPPTVANPVWRTTIPAGSAARDFRRFDVLTFRVTKKYDPVRLLGTVQPTPCPHTPPPPPTPAPPAPPAPVRPVVEVRLIGSNPAHTHTATAVGRLSSLPIVRTLDTGAACDGVLDLTKVHYETWEVDLAPYRAAMGSGFSDVAFVELQITTEVGQPVYVDTLSLVKRP